MCTLIPEPTVLAIFERVSNETVSCTPSISPGESTTNLQINGGSEFPLFFTSVNLFGNPDYNLSNGPFLSFFSFFFLSIWLPSFLKL